MRNQKQAKRRPTAYDRGQHQLICDALKVSSDPEAPGLTAYEAVCVTMFKLELAEAAIQQALQNSRDVILRQTVVSIKKPNDRFEVFPCYGTDPQAKA